MRISRNPLVAALCAGLLALPLASAQAAPPSTAAVDKYVAGQGAQFESLAGSKENLTSLSTGLRTGTEVNLVEQTSTGPKTTTFTPATKPMGYGNITRSLDLANRQLAANGITDPTAAELKAALNGGTITTAKGDVQLAGVLNLRSQGMGWGKIAHTIGVHPSGHASAKALANATTPGAKSTAGGTVTAAGAKGSSATGHGPKRSGIVTAGGSASSPGAPGRGHGNAFGAGGGSSASGIQTAGGHGGGHAYGRAGK
jgi:hypothetical protein